MNQLWTANPTIDEFIKNVFYPKFSFQKHEIEFDGFNFKSDKNCILATDSDPYMEVPDQLLVITKSSSVAPLLSKLISMPGMPTPITSYYKIWDTESANNFFSRKQPKRKKQLIAAFTALIIAEIFLKYGIESDIRKVGYSVASRMFAFSCAKLAISGGTEDELLNLAQAWMHASLLTNNEADSSFVMDICRYSNFISEYIESASSKTIPGHLGMFITNNYNLSGDLFNRPTNIDLIEIEQLLKQNNRENRFLTVEKLILSIQSDPSSDSFTKNLLSGYLLALLNPGSLDFFEMALQINNKFNESIAFAYAICSALLSEDKLSWMYDGFGKNMFTRISTTNHIFEPIFDMSLAELEILSRIQRDNNFIFRTGMPSTIEVELIPGITGGFLNVNRKENSINKNDMELANKLYTELVPQIDHLEQIVNHFQSYFSDYKAKLLENLVPTHDQRKKIVRSRKK